MFYIVSLYYILAHIALLRKKQLRIYSVKVL